MKQWLKDFIHNCFIHPLMMFMPRSMGNRMHDVNADWTFTTNRFNERAIERAMIERSIEEDDVLETCNEATSQLTRNVEAITNNSKKRKNKRQLDTATTSNHNDDHQKFIGIMPLPKRRSRGNAGQN